MWLLENDATLTKDNMISKKWKGNPSSYFCNEDVRPLIICSFNAKWLGPTGASLLASLEQIMLVNSIQQCWI